MEDSWKTKLTAGLPYLLAIAAYFTGEMEGKEEASQSSHPSYTINSPVSVNCSAGEFSKER